MLKGSFTSKFVIYSPSCFVTQNTKRISSKYSDHDYKASNWPIKMVYSTYSKASEVKLIIHSNKLLSQ